MKAEDLKVVLEKLGEDTPVYVVRPADGRSLAPVLTGHRVRSVSSTIGKDGGRVESVLVVVQSSEVEIGRLAR